MPNQQHSRFQIFAKDTTFHGFRELVDSNHPCQKLLWVIIIVASAAIFFYQAQHQVGKYLAGQTGMHIGKLETQNYGLPTLWIAVEQWYWISLEKMKLYSVSYEELQAAKSFLRPVLYYSEISTKEAMQRVKKRLPEPDVSSVMNFFKMISLDTLDASDDQTDLISDKHIFEHGMYYTLNTSSAKPPSIQGAAIQFSFTFDFSSYWHYARRHIEAGDFGPELQTNISEAFLRTVNPPTFYISGNGQPVDISPGYRYQFSVDLRIQRRLVRCTNKFTHPLYSPDGCQFECELAVNKSFGASQCIDFTLHAPYGMPWNMNIPSLPLCSQGFYVNESESIEDDERPVFRQMTQEEETERQSQLKKCQVQCLPACEQRKATVSIFAFELPMGAQANTKSDILIYFPNAEYVSVVEEDYEYGILDLISDMGGLLGLWLGASMMSLIQIVHLCFCTSTGVTTVQTISIKN